MGVLCEALGLSGGGIVALTGAGGKTSLLYHLAAELADGGETVLTTTTTRIHPPGPDQSPGLILAADAAELSARAGTLLSRHRHLTAAAGQQDEDGKLTGFPPATLDILAVSGPFRWIIVEADGAARRSLKAPAGHEPVVPTAARWLVALAGLTAIGRPLTAQWVHRPERVATLTGLPMGEAITAEAAARLLAHPQGLLKGGPPGCRRILFLNQADAAGCRAAGEQISALLRRDAAAWDRILIGQLQPRPVVFACLGGPATAG